MLRETIMISVPGLSVSSLLLQDGDFIPRKTIVTEGSNTFRNKREAKELSLRREMVLSQFNIEHEFLCKTFNYINQIKGEIQAYYSVYIQIVTVIFSVAHSHS